LVFKAAIAARHATTVFSGFLLNLDPDRKKASCWHTVAEMAAPAPPPAARWPLRLLAALFLLAALTSADESCDAGSDQCLSVSQPSSLLQEQLEPEVYERLDKLELLADGATLDSTLDALLEMVLEENASTARAIGLVRKQLKIAGDLRTTTIKKALATWSKVMAKKREREAAPPAAEREYDGPEEEPEEEEPEEEEEVLMEMSGEEMREQMAQQQGQSALRDGIIEHLESLNAGSVNWTMLSQTFDEFVDEQKEKAAAKEGDEPSKFELEGNKLVPVDPDAPAKPLFPLPVMKGIESIPITYTATGRVNSTTVPLLARAITLSRPGDGALDFVQRMLEHGADPNLPWPGGSTSPFLEACRTNRLPLAERMLKEFSGNPLMGRQLGNYKGANPGLALPFALQHTPSMIVAIARRLQGLPTKPRDADSDADEAAASTAGRDKDGDELICGIPHCVSLDEWKQRSPTLNALLRSRIVSAGRPGAPITWHVAAKCVHEWYQPFLQAWFDSCLDNANAKLEDGRSKLERLPPKHGCAKSVHRTLPIEMSFALGGGRETTLWHALARLGAVETMRYLREAVLDSHGWDFAIEEAVDDAGRSVAQLHALGGFTVDEQMLAESLPEMKGYSGPLARPIEAVSKVPTEVTGWWYRQERTPKLKLLTEKQRLEWAQEDTVGGWDGRRLSLNDLLVTGDGNDEQQQEEEEEEGSAAVATIDEVTSDALTPHMFVHRYLLPQRPVLVRGVTNNWVWQENWRKKAFLKRYGASQRFNVSGTEEPVELTLEEFVKQTLKANGGKPKKKKKKSRQTSLPVPKLQEEEDGGKRRATPWLINSRESARRDSRPFMKALDAIPKFQGWFDELSKNGSSFYLPQATDFTLGPGWSGLPPHVDGHAWSALAFGARRWALWPPGADNGGMSLPRLNGSAGRGGEIDWLGDILPRMMNVHSETAAGAAAAPVEGNAVPLLVTVEAGDVLYVPSGWIRGWVNLQESIGITDIFRPNLSEERALALIADPKGHTLIEDMALIDG
jgi:hypothetical protein